MESNKFELTGRCNYIDVKYTDAGFCIVRTAISKKNTKKDSYDSFFITFLGETAEKFVETIIKGDKANITGYIDINEYEKDGKKTTSMQLIGKEYIKVEFDTDKKMYVPVGKSTNNTKKADDKPW